MAERYKEVSETAIDNKKTSPSPLETGRIPITLKNMNKSVQFRTARLTGRPPRPMALSIYGRVLDETAEQDLDRDIQDWNRHRVAPWTLEHAGHEVGVGGFRLGFGDDGLEVLFHFVPEVWGQGLASEFVAAALDHARCTLLEDRFFGRVSSADVASNRVLEKAGFRESQADTNGIRLMRLR